MSLRASSSYNLRAQNLVPRLVVESVPDVPASPVPMGASKGFVPQIPVTVISAEEMQDGIRTTLHDRSGKEVGKVLHENGKTFRLEGDDYAELMRIAKGIRAAPDYGRAVSLALLTDLVFDWLIATHQGITTALLLKFLEEKCEPLIQDVEVWIPVAGTYVESEFMLGDVTFKSITPAMIDQWQREFLEHNPHLEKEADEFFRQRRRDLQGLAAATFQIRAEPRHAYEVGRKEAEIAIAMLRCASLYSASAYLACPSAPLGEEEVKRFQRLLVHDGRVTLFNHGDQSLPGDRWAIDGYTLQALRDCGLGELDAFLKVHPKSDFQNDILSALLLYSRSSLSRDPADKLTYALMPLQDLLQEGQGSPEELGERMGMLVEKSLDRREVLVDVQAVWGLRSTFVRGEAIEEQLELLGRFLRATWLFFINLMVNHSTFQNRTKFIECIEKARLSRGLPTRSEEPPVAGDPPDDPQNAPGEAS